MPNWPWRETVLERRSRIAHLYRDALLEHASAVAADLDALLDTYGQHWITGRKPNINPDEPMTVTEIAAFTGVTINAVYNRITKHGIQPAGTNCTPKYRRTYFLADFNRKLITLV